MIKHLAYGCISFAGWALFVVTFLWPCATLIATCALSQDAPHEGLTFGGRQAALFGRTLLLCAAATVLSIVLSLAPALVIGSTTARRTLACWFAVLLAVLLCPPVVFAFAWSQLLPTAYWPNVSCAVTWALWMWPIPAMLLGAAWARFARDFRAHAMLDASPFASLIYVVIPTTLPVLALSAIVVFLQCLNDYGVPHAYGLQVYATEVLATAESAPGVVHAVVPAIAPLALSAVLVGALLIAGRNAHPTVVATQQHAAPAARATVIFVTLLLGGFALPLVVLAYRLGSMQPIAEAIRIYSVDLARSMIVTVGAGFACVAIGITVTATRFGRTWVLGLSLLAGMMPGAVIGYGMITAFNRPGLYWVYDHEWVLVCAYTARFAWIAVLAGALVIHTRRDSVCEQAALDGATPAEIWWHIVLPRHWPMLVGVLLVVAALSLADVTASSLVRIPAYTPVAHLIIEKFHRFEDDILIVLCMLPVVVALSAATLLAIACGKRQS